MFSELYDVISKKQAGFRKKHTTVDHIFVVKCLVDIFNFRNKPLYCAFVDYSKAFDTIWRSGLWYKLLKSKINGKIVKVIKEMYNDIKSCVFMNGMKSEYFASNIGVRQGENLSRFPFAMYANNREE